jgi:hypothetical protein
VFGMIALYYHAKNGQTTHFIWKGTNLIGLSTKLTEQALKVIRSPNMAVQVVRKLIERQNPSNFVRNTALLLCVGEVRCNRRGSPKLPSLQTSLSALGSNPRSIRWANRSRQAASLSVSATP